MNFNKFASKIIPRYHFDDIIKIEAFDLNNILLDKKSC